MSGEYLDCSNSSLQHFHISSHIKENKIYGSSTLVQQNGLKLLLLFIIFWYLLSKSSVHGTVLSGFRSQSVAKYPSIWFKARLFFTRGVNTKVGNTSPPQWEPKFETHNFAFPSGCVKEAPRGVWRVPSQQCVFYMRAHTRVYM